MNPNSVSPKSRLKLFVVFCWVSFIGLISSQSNYGSFDWSQFIFLGIVPPIFIFGFLWTCSGFLKSKGSDNSSNLVFNWKGTTSKVLGDGGRKIIHIFGIGIGLVIGKALGVHLVIPTAGAMFFGWLAQKFLLIDKSFKNLLGAFSLLAGHTFWMVVGALMSPEAASSVFFDLIFMIGACIVLILNPKAKLAIYSISAFQIVLLIINFNVLMDTDQYAAITVHLGLRAGFLLFAGLHLKDLLATSRNKPPSQNQDAA